MDFRSFILLFFLSLCSYSSSAQLIQVLDAENQEALEGVTFLSNEPKAFAVTNLYGKADLSNFKDAKLIEIRSMGYESLNLSYQEIIGMGKSIKLKAGQLQLEEVVISASRWRQNSSNVASTISVIEPKTIQLQNPQTAADMLGASGKVFIQKSQQGGGSPMIRGFATNRLLYSVDGVRMNTAIFRGGNIQNVINIDPNSIEKTEILFGPGSVSYGSDAIGGVMSFQSYEPQFSLDDNTLVKGSATSRFSSANSEISAHLDLNIGFKKWAFYTSFSNWNFGDLRQGSNGADDYIKDFYVKRIDGEDVVVQQNDKLLQIPSEYAQTNLMQKLRYKVNEDWEFNYLFTYSETSSYGRYDRHNRMRDSLPRYGQWDYGPQKWMMNLLSIENKQATAIYDEFAIRLALQNFNESRISRDFNDDIKEDRSEEVDAYSVNLDLYKKVGSRHQLFYGAEWVLNEVNSNGRLEDISTGIIEKGPSRYPDSEWNSAAVFISEEFSWTEQLNLLGGIRYNYYQLNADFRDNLDFYPLPFSQSTIENHALTGSFGVVYRPNTKWVIKSNLGTAFRAPNVDDIGKIFDSEPGSVVVPNPNLEAEYAYNIDFGIARVFGDLLKLDLTAFYTILENAMVRRDFSINGQDSIDYDGELSQVQAIQNAADAHVYGLQIGFELKLNKYLNLSSDLNFQYGEEETSDGVKSPSRHAAPIFGVSRITFEKKRSRIQFYMEYQGEIAHADLAISEQSKTDIYALDNSGNTYAPSWYTFNLKYLQSFADNFSISAGIENIADLRYRPYSSGISAPGRNFFFAFTAKL